MCLYQLSDTDKSVTAASVGAPAEVLSLSKQHKCQKMTNVGREEGRKMDENADRKAIRKGTQIGGQWLCWNVK